MSTSHPQVTTPAGRSSRRRALTALALVLLSVPLAAMAADGYISAYVNLRAGPDARYPRVAVLHPGMAVSVYGCLDTWSWCDVSVDGWRGWISADYVSYPYNDQRVVIASYGGRIGLPVVSFALNTYWGEHYRGRPWYAERDRWGRRGYGPPPHPTMRRPVPPPRPAHRPMPQRPGPEHGHGKPGRPPAHRPGDREPPRGGGNGGGGGHGNP